MPMTKAERSMSPTDAYDWSIHNDVDLSPLAVSTNSSNSSMPDPMVIVPDPSYRPSHFPRMRHDAREYSRSSGDCYGPHGMMVHSAPPPMPMPMMMPAPPPTHYSPTPSHYSPTPPPSHYSPTPSHYPATMSAPPTPASTQSVPNLSSSSFKGGSSGSPRSYQSKKTATKSSKKQRAAKGRVAVPDSANDIVTARRQKRLERNRESARLSRRRRKQYLEVLEDRVSQLSEELDAQRRDHVSKAAAAIARKRQEILMSTNKKRVDLDKLESSLSRTSKELRVMATFQSQQLKSFSFPSHTKFILWLTLQDDTYFRGGRAASERLSAARIGERMLNSGTDKVGSDPSMWPLFCNEVGLSYEQEERLRNFQRTLLATHETWLERHTGLATERVLDSLHNSVQAAAATVAEKNQSVQNRLSPEQRMRLQEWSARNKHRLARMFDEQKQANKAEFVHKFEDGYKVAPLNHVSANLYILNHRLKNILHKLPKPDPLVVGAALKRLSRRPSFESLGSRTEKAQKRESELMRNSSFASSGSLKRCGSEMTVDDPDKVHVPPISPSDAETAAMPLVQHTLAYVERIVPIKLPQSQVPIVTTPTPIETYPIPPVVSSTSTVHEQPIAHEPHLPSLGPPPPPFTANPGHMRSSSFLPPHLNVVHEDLFAGETGDDIFMLFEDWGVGEGMSIEDTNTM